MPQKQRKSKYAFFCWFSFRFGLALIGIISNIATGDSILESFFLAVLFSLQVVGAGCPPS